MSDCRLLIDPALSGPVNMARDEALLRAAGEPGAGPTLRLYAWSPPTISLGFFQDYAEFAALPSPAGGLAVVRRTTGGGAILHDLEVTYSIAVPSKHPWVRDGAAALYRLAHRAVIEAVGPPARLFGCRDRSCDAPARRGPFFCFARRHDLDVVVPDDRTPGGLHKLCGSAQRRTARAVLQHGSLILDSRFDQQPCARWAQLAPGITFDMAVSRLVLCFEASLGVRLTRAAWLPDELAAADPITTQYAGTDWTVHRQRPREASAV